ncbi:MAG: GGDEF domain-containing protein [Sphingomonadales bacterium]
MAYLDPKNHFAIGDRLRNWLGDKGRAEEASPSKASWQEHVYTDIGSFLFDNKLDPTPDNYDLAYQFRAASNAILVAAIRAEIDKSGALDADAAERIFTDTAGSVSPDALSKFAQQIEEQANDLTTIARQSGRDASDFRTALEKECASGAEPGQVMELTQAMVARTRAAEAQLRLAQKELQGLRVTLVEAQRAADVDPLTELPNRRAFKRELEQMIVTATQKGIPLSLAFCDIDHFKRVNDTHGHETGDRVLRYVASTLARAFEKNGLVGRFGGEEFVVALPAMALTQAKKLIDETREKLCARHLYTSDEKTDIGCVSFSAGVTALTSGDGTTELLKRADDSLYKAKGSGRNCVVIG